MIYLQTQFFEHNLIKWKEKNFLFRENLSYTMQHVCANNCPKIIKVLFIPNIEPCTKNYRNVLLCSSIDGKLFQILIVDRIFRLNLIYKHVIILKV